MSDQPNQGSKSGGFGSRYNVTKWMPWLQVGFYTTLIGYLVWDRWTRPRITKTGRVIIKEKVDEAAMQSVERRVANVESRVNDIEELIEDAKQQQEEVERVQKPPPKRRKRPPLTRSASEYINRRPQQQDNRMWQDMMGMYGQMGRRQLSQGSND